MGRSIRELKCNDKFIAPSLLAANFANLQDDISSIESAGIKILHLDVMDGHFVPNISMGQPVIRGIRNISGLIFDTHLMISEPIKYIESFVKSGADHITFHYESEGNVQNTIDEIKKHGLTVGISIKPGTLPQVLLPYLSQIDMVLVMTVEPGFGGQSFMDNMLPKVKFLRGEIDKYDRKVFLQVDGGIDEKTISKVSAAGANIFVAGTSVFRPSGGICTAIKILESKY